MSPSWVQLYHRLPARARSAAATLRGWYLNRWRQSADSEQLVAAARQREHWTADQWRQWREERLAFVLHRAATRVPFYRDHWQARRRRGDRASWELLENWPLLEKDELRAEPRRFIADDCDPARMFCEQTSGTTGKPLDVWRSRATVTALHAIVAARTKRWDGIPAGVRWARLGGQLVIPVRQRRPPFWVWNAAMRQLYLSSFHLAPDLIRHSLDALRRYRVVYLAGYPSSIYALAHEAVRLGRSDIRLTAVYTNAEPLQAEQRAVIVAAFNCPVRETYGMAETVAAASECAAGRLHQWPEIGQIEVHDEGELVCTGLLNSDMPLIRYRVGDRAPVEAPADPCPCGRTLPAMPAIEGRTNDVLVTTDGRQVFWLNPVMYGLPVRQSQIVQERLDLVRVRIAPAVGFTRSTERTIIARLRERLGDLRVIVERVAEVPRTANGKVRAVICDLSAEERAAALHNARTTNTSNAGPVRGDRAADSPTGTGGATPPSGISSTPPPS
ncbi:MAG: phenylacetate--CoA ligase family protein [Gemmatimonadales bacterium]